MSEFKSKSAVAASAATFDEMLKQFGVVTVMNARVYKDPLYGSVNDSIMKSEDLRTFKAHDIVKELLKKDGEGKFVHDNVLIDTLKIANINMEGPTKTVTGGQYVNPLIKFGKTATIEMQDALGRGDVIELLGGGIVEAFKDNSDPEVKDAQVAEGFTNVLHMGQDFSGAKTILGESFFIDRASGSQVEVYILLYEMLPDSIMNLTQDAEGDATVFDLNGSLSAVDILIGNEGTTEGIVKGVFYSVLPKKNNYTNAAPTSYSIIADTRTSAEADAVAIALVNNIDTKEYSSNAEVQLSSLGALPEGYEWYNAAAEGQVITSIAPTAEGVHIYLGQN